MQAESSTIYLHPLPGDKVGLSYPSRLALSSDSDDRPEGVEGVVPDGGVWKWIHIAPFGRHEGHPRGPIVFSREAMNNIVRLFMRRQNPIKVDYEHDTLNKSVPGYDRGAAGYVHALEIRGDGFAEGSGLWGLVEFTSRAAEKIKAGEFVYSSPVIVPDSIDRKTGKPVGLELVQVAITSDPFIDGQCPTVLTRLSESQGEANMSDENKTPEQESIALADEIAADLTSVLNKLSDATGKDQAAVVASMLEKFDEIAALISGSQEEEGAPSEEPAAATATEAAPAAPAAMSRDAGDKWTKIMQDQLQAMSREIKELKTGEENRKKAAIAAQVDGLIRDGKCHVSQREDAIWAFTTDPARAARMFSNPVVQFGSQISTEAPKGDGAEAVTLSRAEELAVRNLVQTGLYNEEKATQYVIKNRS